jgi:hypothetical protein
MSGYQDLELMVAILGIIFGVTFFAVLVGFGAAIAHDYLNDNSKDGIR